MTISTVPDVAALGCSVMSCPLEFQYGMLPWLRAPLSQPAASPSHPTTSPNRALEQAPDRRHQIYFSKTFSICPTFFSTFPVFFSAVPSACKLGLFVTLPAVSLTLPFTS